MQKERVLNISSMPIGSPSYPLGPYRFINREYLVITYETDMAALRAVVPEPLEIPAPIVKYEFIAMPDSSGLGNYMESGQVIPVRYRGENGGYVHSMYLNSLPAIAAGREIWGFPKKWGVPQLKVHEDMLVGTLDYGGMRVATAAMGFKHQSLDQQECAKLLGEPSYLLKLIPDVNGKPRICELVRYALTDITVKGAWTGPASLALTPHALAPVADLPVRRIISASHILADLTLPYGEVIFDYLN